MPTASPFHERTSALCKSLRWKEWAGYHAVCRYGVVHDPEYFAVRHAAGLLDVTPLFKLDVSGPDATAFLTYVTARNVARLKLGQVAYSCWCDEHGKLLDDGTITRWDDSAYRVTSADPSYAHLLRHARGFDVTIEDVSDRVAALALQGPRARAVLQSCCEGQGDDGIAALRYFRAMRSRIAGREVRITRTGYTGDLGYELWMDNADALAVYDTVTEAGGPHGLLPVGLDALDMLRVEAGYILLGVDYFSARRCLIEAQKSTPYEMGLGWTVHTEREPFLGKAALRREKREGSEWTLIGLDIGWDELEALHARHGLPPHVAAEAWRTAVPVFSGGVQVGQATSGSWSPQLKKNIALASVRTPHGVAGSKLQIEVTVEYERHRIWADVAPLPFLDLARKRA